MKPVAQLTIKEAVTAKYKMEADGTSVSNSEYYTELCARLEVEKPEAMCPMFIRLPQ